MWRMGSGTTMARLLPIRIGLRNSIKTNVPSTQHNLSLSGGTEKFNWSVSGSFLLQNGLISHGHDELDRYTLNT